MFRLLGAEVMITRRPAEGTLWSEPFRVTVDEWHSGTARGRSNGVVNDALRLA